MYSRMAVAFPVPVRPVTKMLYPGFSSPRPNWRERRPRSCPTNSVRGASSSVHSNWKVAGSSSNLSSRGGMRSFSTSIMGRLYGVSIRGLEQPAVHVAAVGVDVAFAEEEGDLPLGRLHGVGAVDEVLGDVEAEVAADGGG